MVGAAGWAGGLLVLQRAVDIVELIGGDDLGSAAGWASAGLSAAASSIVLAFADIALALPAGASAEASCALALATDGGIAVEPLPVVIGDVGRLLGGRGFQRRLAGFSLRVFFRVARLGVFVERDRRARGFFRFCTCGRSVITRRRLRWTRETHEQPCR